MDDAAITRLLATAREAREARDQWRRIGPVLAQLRAAGVSLRQIHAATGISPATVARIARTGGSTPSTTGS